MGKGKKQPEPRKTAHLKKAAFLAAYAECGNVAQACVASGVGRRTHYEWLEKDGEYVKGFADANDRAADALEQEARRRARDGVRKVITHKGELVTVPVNAKGDVVPRNSPDCVGDVPLIEHEYSDTLLIFLLKGARPEKYRDNHQVDVTSGGKALTVKVLRGVSMEEI